MGQDPAGNGAAPARLAGGGRAARGRAAGGLLLLALVLAVYLPVTGYDFVSYDDPQYVTDNPAVLGGLTPEGARWAFEIHGPSMWVPLTWLSHQATVSLAGAAGAGPHHAVNLALHAAAVLLLYLFLLKVPGLGGRPASAARSGPGAAAPGGGAGWAGPAGAWAVAALWAVHPLHVESVAWVTERKDVLAGACWMLTLLAYRGYARRPGAVRYALVLGAAALALAAKPVAVTLPFVLLLLDFWPLRRLGPLRAEGEEEACPAVSPARAVAEKLPLLAMAAFSSVMTLLSQASMGALGGLERFPLALRAGNAAISYGAYLWRILWPSDLAVYYPYPDRVPPVPLVLSLLLLLAVSALALGRARRHPAGAVGWLWYLGVLVPMLGLVQAGRPQAMADRFAYLPAVGIYLAVVAFLVDWAAPRRRRRIGVALAGCLAIALLAAAARRQVTVWRDSETLFRNALSATEAAYSGAGPFGRTAAPSVRGRWFLHLHLGVALVGKGRLGEGIAELERASALDPSDPLSHYHLAGAHARAGRRERAAEEYRAALALAPGNVPSLTGLAQLEIDAGRPAGALPLLRRAAQAAPEHAWVRDRLGVALLLDGQEAAGLRELEAAARLSPWDEQIRRHLEQARSLAAGAAPGGRR